MTTSKHTKGPLTVTYREKYADYVITKDRYPLATVKHKDNAFLFASANGMADLYEKQGRVLRTLADGILNLVPEPPERNCSCHVAPPCNDCVEHAGLRELFELARAATKGPKS